MKIRKNFKERVVEGDLKQGKGKRMEKKCYKEGRWEGREYVIERRTEKARKGGDENGGEGGKIKWRGDKSGRRNERGKL